MADNIRKRAEENGLSEDDPFAELTRILGYDGTSPRPVSQEPADDLALELERELLGEVPDQTGEHAHRSSEAEVTSWEPSPDAPIEPQDVSTEPQDAAEEEFGYPSEPVTEAAPADSNDFDQTVDTEQADDNAFALHERELAFDEGQPVEPAFDFADVVSISAAPQDHEHNHAGQPEYGEQPELAYPDTPAETPPRTDHVAQPGWDYEAASQEEDGSASFDYSRAAAERHEFLAVDDLTAGLEDELASELETNATVGEQMSKHEEWQLQQATSTDAGAEWQPYPIEEAQGEPEVARNSDAFAPDVETVDVPEKAVALTDNLDIPDVPYKEEKPAAQFDEIEEILAGAFGDTMARAEQGSDAWQADLTDAPETSAPAGGQERDHADFSIPEMAAASALGGQAFADRSQEVGYHGRSDANDYDDWEPRHHAQLAPEPGIAPPLDGGSSRLRSRLLMAGAAVGGMAVLGVLTVFALNLGRGDGGGGPVVVAADSSPVKVRPEEPGGVQIPNQDNQVYKRVSGEETNTEPEQARLISGTEEPVDLTPPAQSADAAGSPDQQPTGASGEERVALAPLPTGASQARTSPVGSGELTLPGVEPVGSLRPGNDANAGETTKVEDRLAGTASDEADNINDVISLTPHKVRSLVVRADGTMVPNEVPEPAANNATSADSEGQASEIGSEIAPAVMPARGPIPPSRPANLASAQPQTQQQSAVNTAVQQPAEQPTQQPAEQPTQTAAAVPVTQQATSAWSVQVASQPSAEGAQQSYQDLARRYGNLLQGKGVNIVKADIEGRGTYYRVRIPSASKDEAIRLCEQLKAAGGSCFVSQ